MPKVTVIGTTSWGTTLGILMARIGVDVQLLARSEEEAIRLQVERQNHRFVPNVEFPSSMQVTSSAKQALRDTDLVLFVVPSRTLRQNVRSVRDSLDGPCIVVSATKGLEVETGNRMSQVLREELPSAFHASICALSGPNLAAEIIHGKPSSTVIASPNMDAATSAQAIINSPTFRVYTNKDIVGVEFGGALKNIVALGSGICDGLEYGDNAKAAFMTRGLAEINRLAVAAGANPMTIAGLAGMGDLIATCSSTLSRNHYVGERLAQGETLSDIRASMTNVAEGVDTTAAAVKLSKRLGVEMPIAQATYDVLFNELPLDQAISRLLGRDPKQE